MKILVVYGTNSSGTQFASKLVGKTLSALDHDVVVKRANTVDPKELGGHDLTILASCTWGQVINKQWVQGQLQDHMFELHEKVLEQQILLPGHQFAVFALGDSSYTEFAAAADRLVEFVNDVGGVLVAEPLKIDGWFFYPEKNEQLISAWAQSIGSARRST